MQARAGGSEGYQQNVTFGRVQGGSYLKTFISEVNKNQGSPPESLGVRIQVQISRANVDCKALQTHGREGSAGSVSGSGTSCWCQISRDLKK